MREVAVLALAVFLLPVTSFADAKAGEKAAELCLLCHKIAYAIAPMSTTPLLEGQPAGYLYAQIKAYRDKRRAGDIMQTNTAHLSDKDMRNIADYLSTQKPLRASYRLDAASIEAGKTTAAELRCVTCHGPSYEGTDEIPRLAGQTPGYLRQQLEAFRAGTRQHGTGQRHAPDIALAGPEMDGLAQFLASLK